jgi:GTP-binding protein HflX
MTNGEGNQSIIISLYDDITEIKQLTESLDYSVINTFIQHRTKPEVKTFIGSGKINEIKQYLIENRNISLVVVNGELKPSQWFLLEKEFSVEVYDRIKLILMIFKQRAHRREAQLQVRLAELEYEKPYVKELIHRTRTGEHPGLMAGGEYPVDDYFEMIKKQIKLIKSKLNRIEKDRLIQRKHRHKTGFYLVSLAGYTNAGKSSLLNSLTKSEIAVKNQLFTTLSTLTRKIDTDKIPILLTDTVGFIENLPAWIINAFHSTLEEIKKADLVILVVDASDPYQVIIRKTQTSINELNYLEVKSPIILTLNKSDLLNPDEISSIKSILHKYFSNSNIQIIFISVKNYYGIQTLLDQIISSLPNMIDISLKIPQSKNILSFISWLYEKTYILNITYEESIRIKLKCNEQIKNKIESFCKTNNGIIY